MTVIVDEYLFTQVVDRILSSPTVLGTVLLYDYSALGRLPSVKTLFVAAISSSTNDQATLASISSVEHVLQGNMAIYYAQ